jgi:hypothetical protein
MHQKLFKAAKRIPFFLLVKRFRDLHRFFFTGAGGHLPLLKRVLWKSGKPVDHKEETDENSKEKSEFTPSFEKLLVISKASGVKQLRIFSVIIFWKGQFKKEWIAGGLSPNLDLSILTTSSLCAWRPDLSADLLGHLTGPVATPHVVYYSLYHIFISVLMYTTRTTQITYPNPESYHNLPIL